MIKPTANATLYREYARTHGVCLVCGSNTGGFWRLSTHHIAGRPSDEHCNLFRCCLEPCHQLCEGLDRTAPDNHPAFDAGVDLPKLTLAIILTMKEERDGKSFDPDRLAELLGKPLPEPEPIPKIFVAAWKLRTDF